MSNRFQGLVEVDIRDSVPDWAPFDAPRAPDGAPNMVYIVLDDVGFSAMSGYGGPIETPNIDRVATNGLRYTQWHTTALCSPTRSCLLTGRNHTRNSMACITECAIGFPNASGVIPPENGTLAEILGERGWNTYMVGKWHLCPEAEMNLASTRRNWPTGRGFERFYGFLGAETNQWYPDLVYDNHVVDQPKSPAEGYHLSVDLTDKALEFIKDAKVLAPGKPFFLYYAPGAAHAPHHAPKEWIAKFKGRFDMGYEAIREQTLARQKQMGIIPESTELSALNPIGTPDTRKGPGGKPYPALDFVRPWASLSDDEKRLFCRMAEVYAGFLAHADHQIGRLLDYLEETDQRDNTLVVVVSDNGASGEGGPNGSVNESKVMNGVADDIASNLAQLDELGSPTTYNHYPTGWAMAFNTPFKMWKRYEFNGGTSDACIVSWPKGIKSLGQIPHSLPPCHRPGAHHLGRTRPAAPRDHQRPRAEPLRRREHALQLRRPQRTGRQAHPVLLHAGIVGDWHDGWKAVTTHATVAGWSNFGADTWELYHTDVDRSELRDLAQSEPGRLQELINLWYAEAGANGAFPLDDRSPLEDPHHTPAGAQPRPQPLHLLPRRGRGPRIPGGEHPQPFLRPRDAPGHPSTRSERRHIRPRLTLRRPCPVLKDNRLHYVYNFLGIDEQHKSSPTLMCPRERASSCRPCSKDGEASPGVATGILSLYHGDIKVGEGRIHTQPGKFSIAGEGLCVGRDSGEPVTSDYPGEEPHRFSGGTINRVAVDVSGEPYVDLEREAVAMMSRE